MIMCLKSLQNCVIFKSFKRHLWVFSSSKRCKALVTMNNQCFWDWNFIKCISNYCTCFHNIIRTLSSKHIKEMCNININFNTRLWKNKALATIHMAPIFVNVPSLDNKTKRLGSLDPTCEHYQHHSHVSYMLPLLSFLLCYVSLVHIERCPLSSNH